MSRSQSSAAVMTDQTQSQPRPEPTSEHLTVLPDGLVGPPEVHFLFEQQQKRIGNALGVSVATHIGFILLVLLIGRLLPKQVYQAVLPDRLPDSIVWLSEPGPGGGGGGGGNNTPEPPKKVELPGKEKISVPVEKPPVTPEPPKPEPPKPQEPLNIPAQTMAAATQVTPGALEANTPSVSQGVGTGGGAGTGTGTGIGQGEGSGLGAGTGGGTGGGVYRPGNGVELPRVEREVKPQYTAEAMRAKVQGTVLLECVVLPDGSVGNVQVVKSLDSTFGLDQEAIKAAKQWRFRPGTRQGQPVAVLVTIELTFTLR
jgi:TonB family protein